MTKTKTVEVVELQTKFDVNRKDFLQFCETISVMAEEATIKLITDVSCPSYGLSCTSMDPSHVALIKVFLGLNVEDTFGNKGAVGKQFAVIIDELKKVVKTMKEDTISVELDRSKKGKGTVTIISDTQSTELKMIEERVENNDLPTPKISTNYMVEFDTKEFLAMLRAVENVSDYITFKAEKDGVEYSGEGDRGKTKGVIKGRVISPDSNHKAIVKSTYSLEYLLYILRVMKDGKISLHLSLEKQAPCKIRYLNTDIIDTDWNKQFERVKSIDYYLAPRVE